MALPETYPDAPAFPTLAGKVALVTGSAQGLGEAIAANLAAHGCKLVLTDINAEGIKSVAEAVSAKYGNEAVGVACDITDEEQVAAAFAEVNERFGQLDILVANAGIVISGAIQDFDVAKFRKVVDVNLIGYMLVAKYAAQMMIEQKSGSIIQINSKSGKNGSAKNSAYAASKYGGIGLTHSLALELAEYNVRVNAICPGNLLNSPLWKDNLFEQYAERLGKTVAEIYEIYVGKVPMKRGCIYADVVGVLLYLASDASSYMTGQAINIDGGQTMH